jgi:hypothetical protein
MFGTVSPECSRVRYSSVEMMCTNLNQDNRVRGSRDERRGPGIVSINHRDMSSTRQPQMLKEHLERDKQCVRQQQAGQKNVAQIAGNGVPTDGRRRTSYKGIHTVDTEQAFKISGESTKNYSHNLR